MVPLDAYDTLRGVAGDSGWPWAMYFGRGGARATTRLSQLLAGRLPLRVRPPRPGQGAARR
eukprot:7182559-Pyramimonas_sp.AAC.1